MLQYVPHLAQHMLLRTQQHCAADVTHQWSLQDFGVAITAFRTKSTPNPSMAARLSLKTFEVDAVFTYLQ